jgi:hypothetical protein
MHRKVTCIAVSWKRTDAERLRTNALRNYDTHAEERYALEMDRGPSTFGLEHLSMEREVAEGTPSAQSRKILQSTTVMVSTLIPLLFLQRADTDDKNIVLFGLQHSQALYCDIINIFLIIPVPQDFVTDWTQPSSGFPLSTFSTPHLYTPN